MRARRPWNLVLVGVLIVLVALLVSGYAWADSYQPLTAGSYGLFPAGSVTGRNGETSITFRAGAPFALGFSVRNQGGFTVRVVGVPLVGATPFSTRLLVSKPLEHPRAVPGPTAPFRPFDLGPGEERMLILRGWFASCFTTGAGTVAEFTDLPVRFQFLWRAQTISVPLSSPLVIRFPAGPRCAG